MNGSTHAFEYFSEWRNAPLSCWCGWDGALDPDRTDLYETLMDFRCPRCDGLLAMIGLPSEEDIAAARARGDAEAQQLWEVVLAARAWRAAFEARRLTATSPLPELAGEHLDLVWDLDDDGDYVIVHGTVAVWREPAAWEDWRRFNEAVLILRAHYGARLRSAVPSRAAMNNLCGASIAASQRLMMRFP